MSRSAVILPKRGGVTRLKIESWSNTAGRVVRIAGIFQGVPYNFEHTTVAARVLETQFFNLSKSDLDLPITMTLDVDAPVRRGELYIKASILWGGTIIQRLSAGYLTDSKSVNWPPGVFEGSTEGPGLTRTIIGTNPAANVEISETVPANARWKIKGIIFVFETDANVATRVVKIVLDDGTSDFDRTPDTVGQVASLSQTYNAKVGGTHLTTLGVGSDHILALIDAVLGQGGSIKTATTNFQATDNYGAPILHVEEWIEE